MDYQRLSVTGYGINQWAASSIFGALSGFRLYFEDDDHKIKSLAAGGTTAVAPAARLDYTLGMIDKSQVLDREDAYSAWSQYIELDSIGLEFARGVFSGVAEAVLPITPIRESELFVLRGFAFEQTGSHDHNIRKIGLRLNPDRNGMIATFADDSPQDDGFEIKIVYGRQPVPSRLGFNVRREFLGPFTDEVTFTESAMIEKRESGKSLLTGFSFEFLDDDHFIREVKVDPVTDTRFDLVFTDDERDHSVRAVIDYLVENTA